MSKKLIILAIFAAIIYCTSALPHGFKCGPNQKYTMCVRSCPSICKNSPPRTCLRICVPGCQCDRGFVENADGKCVLIQDCS